MAQRISRALLSVSDKSGIIEFARQLADAGVVLLSTGGTAAVIAENGIEVIEVSDVTGFPEMMDGRVKTLHPKIHGAILGRRDKDSAVMKEHNITGIDLVVVNLYPFVETIARPGCTLAEAIENIDIGGPAMIRSAAKNHADVAVVTSPADYDSVAESIANTGGVSDSDRYQLACKAFAHTAQYDSAVSGYLSSQPLGVTVVDSGEDYAQTLQLSYNKIQDLRYGENPHQSAAFYRCAKGASTEAASTAAAGTEAASTEAGASGIANAEQLQGKELSFNNISDSDAALECVLQFDEPACVIVKHANPCGVSIAANVSDAYEKAYITDPVSAFGGIIAFNRELDAATARSMVDRQFIEVLLAPSYQSAALEVLREKPNVRVLQFTDNQGASSRLVYQSVGGGLLVQQNDSRIVSAADLTVATTAVPDEAQIRDLLFAWKVVKFVKSNAIVFCKDGASVGIGAGQMSRVYSAKIAAIKAADAELEIASTVMASDAFFPFRDTVDQAAEYGVAAIIQPGGSMRDQEAIDAANERGIAMVFTGVRHFRH